MCQIENTFRKNQITKITSWTGPAKLTRFAWMPSVHNCHMGPGRRCSPPVSLSSICAGPLVRGKNPQFYSPLTAARPRELTTGNPAAVAPDRLPHCPPAAAAPAACTLALGLSHRARAPLRLRACAAAAPLRCLGQRLADKQRRTTSLAACTPM
jgi:hypothetical protein